MATTGRQKPVQVLNEMEMGIMVWRDGMKNRPLINPGTGSLGKKRRTISDTGGLFFWG
jgi:hypothetical protein